MINTNQRTGDCKSSIIGSIPIRASNFSCEKNFIRKLNYVISNGVDTPVTIRGNGKFVSLKFTYKGNSHTQRLYVPLAQLTGLDIETVVKKFIQKIDGLISLRTLLDFYLEHGTGSLATRKKNVANFIDYCKREGISLDEPISILSKTDEVGRTLPERWEALYNLPHKLRQVRSIFGRKNIVLFKREGWDTSVFGNFSHFIPETTVSQPFSTSDIEVDHIINFFNAAKEEHPIFYKIYLLAFGCGLRKSEIYQVKYDYFTTFNGQHLLLLPFATKRTKLKNLNGVTEKVP